MIRALAIALLAVPAAAQEARFVAGDEPGVIGTIVLTNRWTAVDGPPLRVETPRGPVTIHYRSTQNNLCTPDCADVYAVVDWPAGTVVHPAEGEIGELGAVGIVLRELVGM